MDTEDLQGATLREAVRKRSDVLDCLLTAPASKPELVDRLDVSRSTVDRAVDSLCDVGLIQRVDGLYNATVHGELLQECQQEYIESTDALTEAAPILETLPVDSSIDRSLFEHGTTKLAAPHAPERALMTAVAELKAADRLRVFSPVAKSSYFSLLHSEVVEGDLETDLILGQEATKSLSSLAAVTETVEPVLNAEAFDLYTTDNSLPYLLYLMSGDTDAVGVTVHDDGGIVGSVTASNPDAVEWGQEKFERLMDAARRPDTAALL